MSIAKPVEQRAGHHAPPAVLPADGTVATAAPEPPDGVTGALADRWRGVWSSPIAVTLDPVSDYMPMARLFALYGLDESISTATRTHIERLQQWDPESDDDEPAAFDPQLVAARMRVASEIRSLEQTLGITPRGRLTIGLAVLAAGKAAGAQQERHDDADD